MTVYKRIGWNRMKFLILGERPSKSNRDYRVPFIGTTSWVTLQAWMLHWGIEFEDCYFMNVSDEVNGPIKLEWAKWEKLDLHRLLGTPTIALGRIAEKVANKANLNMVYCPHPSPRNRTLNDKDVLYGHLDRVKDFIKKETHRG